MGQKAQQGFNTLIAGFIALLLAERFDSVFVAEGSRDMFVVIAGTGLGTVISVMLEIGRQSLLKWAERNGIDLKQILGSIAPLVLVALLIGGCKTTPTDKYYTALTSFAGIRASAIAYCRVPATPVEHCRTLREKFFVPGDAAVEAVEAARQEVLQACALDATTPECEGAGRKLSMAAAGLLSISNSLSAELSAQGVNP